MKREPGRALFSTTPGRRCLNSSPAPAREDAVPARANECGDDEQDDGKQDLPLQELHDADDGDNDSQEPKSHGGFLPQGKASRSTRPLHLYPYLEEGIPAFWAKSTA